MSDVVSNTMEEIPTFRANKRRKIVRHKDSEPNINLSNVETSLRSNEPVEAEDEGNNIVSDLVKLRKQTKFRSGGVRFSQERRPGDNDEAPEDMVLTRMDSDEERLRSIANRFVGSTGQVVDVDKHMMSYVDSEMAKRHNVVPQDLFKQHTNQSMSDTPENLSVRPSKQLPEYQPPSQLSEFDLGQDAHERNLARTEAAIAQAQSGQPVATQQPKPRKPRKPRLGRDGKPLRPRVRKRRNSEDVARDALVEQMLHENRVAAYEGEQQANSDTYGEDEDADERLAEQFKQQFLDAMAERQQKNQVKAATAARAKGIGPDQSGPKLGGSRSARAKMVQMQQSTQQKGNVQK